MTNIDKRVEVWDIVKLKVKKSEKALQSITFIVRNIDKKDYCEIEECNKNKPKEERLKIKKHKKDLVVERKSNKNLKNDVNELRGFSF